MNEHEQLGDSTPPEKDSKNLPQRPAATSDPFVAMSRTSRLAKTRGHYKSYGGDWFNFPITGTVAFILIFGVGNVILYFTTGWILIPLK